MVYGYVGSVYRLYNGLKMKNRVEEFVKGKAHESWHTILVEALLKLDSNYLEYILSEEYIPSNGRLFSAFKTLPKKKVKYILFGQDPYPRKESATGYAFIDGAVESIFSENGLSKAVNRATSLRNFTKMALVAKGLLDRDNTSKEAIAKIDKNALIESIYELKDNFEKNGVLLLNTALIFESKEQSNYHIKMWKPFIKHLLENIDTQTTLILFGNPAKKIKKDFMPKQRCIELEHPYNVSFITSGVALELFGGMKLYDKV